MPIVASVPLVTLTSDWESHAKQRPCLQAAPAQAIAAGSEAAMLATSSTVSDKFAQVNTGLSYQTAAGGHFRAWQRFRY